METVQVTLNDVHAELWNRGVLLWLLYEHQKPIYTKIREVIASDEIFDNSYVIDCARQFGKSFIMFLIAVEECLRKPYTTIAYVAPLKSQVIEIVTEKTFRTIFETAPKDLIPKLDGSELVFKNGSRIRLAGTDNKNYANLRGGHAHQIFLDEAGFMSDLSDGVLPSVTPMLKTTGGKIIFASTPPENLDHDYYNTLREHEESNQISTFTIWHDKTLTQKQLEKIIHDCKGRDTTMFKREYECQRIADTSKQVVPQLTRDVADKILLPNEDYLLDPLYFYWKKYIVADWGGRDKTAILFAHYNYRTKKLVVEDHLDLNGSEVTPKVIATRIKEKTKRWEDNNHKTYYICDSNNIIIQNSMINDYKLPFVSTSKSNLKSQMVEKVKTWVYDDRLEFGPLAEFALKSAMSAHWDKSQDKFATSKIFGHYDHTAALVYLIRNVDEFQDPIPATIGYDPDKHFMVPEHISGLKKNTNKLNALFKR